VLLHWSALRWLWLALALGGTAVQASSDRNPPPAPADARFDGGGSVSPLHRSPDGRFELKAESRFAPDPIGVNGRFTLLKSASPNAATCLAEVNHTAIYYAPANQGYGVAVTHQDQIVVAIWYTYNEAGRPTWYTAATTLQSDGHFRGQFLFNTGTPLAQISGAPAKDPPVPQGTVDLSFSADRHLDFAFTPSGAGTQHRILEALPLSANPLVCEFTTGPRTNATNFTDLWWNPTEDGWGLSLIQQGDLIFMAWYTYASDRQPQWLTSVLLRQANGSFSGALNRTSAGTPYTTAPNGNVTAFPVPEVGSATLNFSNGENGVLGYTVDGVTQSHAITRLVFGLRTQICQ
jgi:hypothetical protein